MASSIVCPTISKSKELFTNTIWVCPPETVKHKKGNEGFGYDPYFIPASSKKTFAEMGLKEKMVLSHRFEAFKILSTIQK